MCLITEQKKPIKIRKDRIVYKTGYGGFVNGKMRVLFTPYNKFKYELNKLYETKFTYLPTSSKDAIGHDDMVTVAYGWKSERVLNSSLIVIAAGFHAATKKQRLKTAYYDLVECVIPKGSLIYEDKTGLIVSNKIIIKKEVFNTNYTENIYLKQ